MNILGPFDTQARDSIFQAVPGSQFELARFPRQMALAIRKLFVSNVQYDVSEKDEDVPYTNSEEKEKSTFCRELHVHAASY